LTPSVTRDNRVEVGFRSTGENTNKVAPDQPEESLMLTGDQNIVAVHFNVFWHIKNAGDYLFGVRHPDALVKVAAESAMREIIGRTPIQQALTDGRAKIEQDSQVLLQSLLDKYGAGIELRQIQLLAVDPPAPVVDAFNDVQRARLDRDRASNEAEAYSNDIIPRARGDAERLNQEAQAYAQEVINHSEGDAKRFLSVLEAYRANKDVTAERIYLDTMEEVLKNANKIVLDREGNASSVLPYLPLPALKSRPDKAPEKAQ
jgi:membrane protease subunit HflK